MYLQAFNLTQEHHLLINMYIFAFEIKCSILRPTQHISYKLYTLYYSMRRVLKCELAFVFSNVRIQYFNSLHSFFFIHVQTHNQIWHILHIHPLIWSCMHWNHCSGYSALTYILIYSLVKNSVIKPHTHHSEVFRSMLH